MLDNFTAFSNSLLTLRDKANIILNHKEQIFDLTNKIKIL